MSKGDFKENYIMNYDENYDDGVQMKQKAR